MHGSPVHPDTHSCDAVIDTTVSSSIATTPLVNPFPKALA